MDVKRTVRIDSPRNRPGRKRLKIASGPDTAKVLSLCDARRMKKSEETVKRLRGINLPADYLVGPDEPGHDLFGGFTGLMGFPMPIAGINLDLPGEDD